MLAVLGRKREQGGLKKSGPHEYGNVGVLSPVVGLIAAQTIGRAAIWRLHGRQDEGMALPVTGRCSRQNGD
jgi:hypothetical protein